MNQSCSSFPAPGGMKEHERCDNSDFAFFSLLQFKSKRHQAGPTMFFSQRALFFPQTCLAADMSCRGNAHPASLRRASISAFRLPDFVALI
jgi:hypothetical protein